MDPVARRFMWEVISDIVTKREKCSLILTTHSMEECEALCTRIGIMVGGVLRCLGSNQRLRSRYGLGYQVEMSMIIPTDEEVQEKLRNIMDVSDIKAPQNSELQLNLSQVKRIFSALMREKWCERLTEEDTGAELNSSLENIGYVSGSQLASWVILEDIYDVIMKFLSDNFAGFILRERQTIKLRVEIPSLLPNGGTRQLSHMFGAMESHKDSLHISEYSVSQTSLEQIFNFFAAQQEEEKGVARGIR